jgi:hypothetical protein
MNPVIEMPCEAIEPAHGRLAPRGPALEYLVSGNAAVMKGSQRGRVDERNACATAFPGMEITTQGFAYPELTLFRNNFL